MKIWWRGDGLKGEGDVVELGGGQDLCPGTMTTRMAPGVYTSHFWANRKWFNTGSS